jgi:hypothetical protein
MITKWGVKNFKSILQADLDLAPLTVFTGINSSGKSAFLHSIAMLAQSARIIRKPNIKLSPVGGLIDVKGELIDLDSFGRIYHGKTSEGFGVLEDEININLVIPLNENENLYFELGLGSEVLEASGDADKLHIKPAFPVRLQMKQACLGCKKKEDVKNFAYLKYGKKISLSVTDSESIVEMLKEIKSNKNYNTIELNDVFINYDRSYFLPDTIEVNYNQDNDIIKFLKTDGKFDPIFKDFTNFFVNRIVDFSGENIENKKYPAFLFETHFFYQFLLDLCTNNRWWEDNKNILSQEEKIFFSRIPGFEDMFSQYKRKHPVKGDFFDIKLSDWYRVLSKQDKQTQKAIEDVLMDEENKKILAHIIYLAGNFCFNLPPKLKNARDYLDDYFKNKIKYLSPLREKPQWGYSGDNETFTEEKVDTGSSMDFMDKLNEPEEKKKAIYHSNRSDVGVNGNKVQLAIKNLYYDQYQIEKYFSPGFFETPDYKPEENEKGFLDGLNEWLDYFDIGDKIKIQVEDGRVTINIVINGQEFALPQLGTGVSQILPILVMCLAAPVGSTLIIQEPEQSLHPKLQAQLADFFIAMVLSGRQCLIETHSEYILEQLRYRIVVLPKIEDKFLHEQTKLYFVTKRNGISHFKNITINNFAALKEWPEDFFDVSHNISRKMLKEIIKKVKLSRQNG